MTQPHRPSFVSRQVVQSQYLFLDLIPPKGIDFILTCAGKETCEPNYHLVRNSFHYHAIEYINSGSWELVTDGKVIELGPGSVFAYGPESHFHIKARGSEAQEKYFIDFAGARSAEILASSGLEFGAPKILTHVRPVREIFDQILDCHRYTKAVAKEMGTQLSRLLLMRIREDARVLGIIQRRSYESFERCRDYISQNFRDLQSVDQIAQSCHLDRAYLARLFKEHLGESPHQFLTRLKMESAAELLRSSRMPVKAIAEEVGYRDPFHFSRVFKRSYGIAPQRYSVGMHIRLEP